MAGTSVTSEQLLKALQFHYNFTQFRPHQEEAIQATLNGKDSLLILPTGKSLIMMLRVQSSVPDMFFLLHAACCSEMNVLLQWTAATSAVSKSYPLQHNAVTRWWQVLGLSASCSGQKQLLHSGDWAANGVGQGPGAYVLDAKIRSRDTCTVARQQLTPACLWCLSLPHV